MRSKISYAVAAILGGASCGAAAAEPAAGTTEGGALEEIIVTAQKREQSIQDVPISMQALTGQALQQLNVSTVDNYIKVLPSVTTASNGPRQNEVFMRGLSAGSQASQGSGSTGASPNVSIYLDNQSGQLPNRNLDIYAADLNRIEVLEGPQGDRKSTRLNSSHRCISYAVFCLKKKKKKTNVLLPSANHNQIPEWSRQHHLSLRRDLPTC